MAKTVDAQTAVDEHFFGRKKNMPQKPVYGPLGASGKGVNHRDRKDAGHNKADADKYIK